MDQNRSFARRVARRGLLAAAALTSALGACGAPRPTPAGAPAQQETRAMPTSSSAPRSQPTNRLSRAASPYLLQHQHNPVDWYEWGPEALEKARSEGKPIFLSIGYAACHWCHVMAHESFESESTAAVMNRLFVNIKVDREERPDLDEIYMQATMILNQGQGGWPMSVWLTPERKPFFAGTYFPPESRWGRPGFAELCARIGEVWRDKRADIEADASRLTELVRGSLTPDDAQGVTFSLTLIDQVVEKLAGAFDAERGGMHSGGTNKFPPSMALDLMLRYLKRHSGGPATQASSAALDRIRQRVTVTLDRMAAGGIYDHLAGGIARYSTDVQWLVPHFEKMLYDQALVSRIYVDAYAAGLSADYARVAREIFDYVIADLQSPEGGFYSSRDADSEGVEGKFYVWTKAAVLAALGRDEGELFCSYYDVSDAGNWQDPHEPDEPKNILHAPRSLDAVAKLNRIEPAVLAERLEAAREKLRAVRATRVAPGLDDKVLCEWNGLMIASLARGGATLNEPKYVAAAARAADAILKHQSRDGRLLRAWRGGRVLDAAFLADYACLIEGLLELYEATFEKRWLDRAAALNEIAIERFWDDAAGGFFFTAGDHEQLITRSKDIRDSAHPSGNSVQLMNLRRLAAIFDDARLRALADRSERYFAAEVLGSPGASERFLAAVEFGQIGPVEIAVIGDPADPRTAALLRVVRESYLPNRIILLANPAAPADAPDSPLLRAREMVNGAPAAYVCRNYACKLPAMTPAELKRQLSDAAFGQSP